MKYRKAKNDEWFRPRRNNWKMACCDCGLVHSVNFRLVKSGNGKAIECKWTRDNRATGQKRRYLKSSECLS